MVCSPVTTSLRSDKGLAIVEIPNNRFRAFAKRHAHSPEVGPIKTGLDHDADRAAGGEYRVYGLLGCGKLCAVACLALYQSKPDVAAQTLKLDSVIVDPALRRRGLAGLLVTNIFVNLLTRSDLHIKRIYAHSVHPATVLLLRRLRFRDPLRTGAPISHLEVEKTAHAKLVSTLEGLERERSHNLKLQCELCQKKHRNARPWCVPRG